MKNKRKWYEFLGFYCPTVKHFWNIVMTHPKDRYGQHQDFRHHSSSWYSPERARICNQWVPRHDSALVGRSQSSPTNYDILKVLLILNQISEPLVTPLSWLTHPFPSHPLDDHLCKHIEALLIEGHNNWLENVFELSSKVKFLSKPMIFHSFRQKAQTNDSFLTHFWLTFKHINK